MIDEISVPKHVAAETVDEETIIINFATGAYHTLEGAAADLWARIVSTAPTALSESDKLILSVFVEAGVAEVSPTVQLPTQAPDAIAVGLKSYTDMSALLLADPIHEVDSQGWPKLLDKHE